MDGQRRQAGPDLTLCSPGWDQGFVSAQNNHGKGSLPQRGKPGCLGLPSVLIWSKKGGGGSFSTLQQGEKRPSSITHHP